MTNNNILNRDFFIDIIKDAKRILVSMDKAMEIPDYCKYDTEYKYLIMTCKAENQYLIAILENHITNYNRLNNIDKRNEALRDKAHEVLVNIQKKMSFVSRALTLEETRERMELGEF